LHGLVVRPCGLLPSRLESARARSGTKERNLLIKTTEREHSSSVCDFSPKEPWQEFLLECVRMATDSTQCGDGAVGAVCVALARGSDANRR